VRAVEHRARKAFDHRCGNFIVGRGRRVLLLLFYVFFSARAVLVIVFTSVVVRHRRGVPRDVLSAGQGVGRGAVALLDLDAGAAVACARAPLHDLAAADLLVQGEDPVHERLRTGWTAGDVHVDGRDLVDALRERVVVEHAARA